MLSGGELKTRGHPEVELDIDGTIEVGAFYIGLVNDKAVHGSNDEQTSQRGDTAHRCEGFFKVHACELTEALGDKICLVFGNVDFCTVLDLEYPFGTDRLASRWELSFNPSTFGLEVAEFCLDCLDPSGCIRGIERGLECVWVLMASEGTRSCKVTNIDVVVGGVLPLNGADVDGHCSHGDVCAKDMCGIVLETHLPAGDVEGLAENVGLECSWCGEGGLAVRLGLRIADGAKGDKCIQVGLAVGEDFPCCFATFRAHCGLVEDGTGIFCSTVPLCVTQSRGVDHG